MRRVVLPADIDPETKAPSFVMVPGTIFDQPDRWQKLELVHMLPTIERLARVLRASSRRPVPLDGAYIERVVVNLLDSPGPVGGVPRRSRDQPGTRGGAGGMVEVSVIRESRRAAGKGRALAAKASSQAKGRFRLERNLLEKRGSETGFVPWFPTAIDAPGANPVELRRAGFDVLVDDGQTRSRTAQAAGRQRRLAHETPERRDLDRRPASRARSDDRLSVAAVGRVLAPRRSPRAAT